MIENVHITSFQRSFGLRMPLLSVAMYQPQGYNFPRLDWALIGNPDGSDWIRPRNFIGNHNPLQDYREALWARYDSRLAVATSWAEYIAADYYSVAFCCWCPHDRAAQRQMGEHGSFVCHTDVLGEWMESRLGIRVWYDSERRHMKAIG